MRRVVWIGVLFVLGAGGQFFLRQTRPIQTPLMTDGVLATLGGFRSLVAEAIWFRADRLQENGRYVELAQLASTLTFLEPHTPEVWSYAAWNLAYNVSIMMPTPEDRWRWVDAALRLLRDDGIRLNPQEAELYRELAWFFQLKIGTDLDAAADLYRLKWREIVTDVAARNAWHELAMDETKMAEVERLYAIDDWADPQASALYWAHTGMPFADQRSRAFLKLLIRNSRVIMKKARATSLKAEQSRVK